MPTKRRRQAHCLGRSPHSTEGHMKERRAFVCSGRVERWRAIEDLGLGIEQIIVPSAALPLATDTEVSLVIHTPPRGPSKTETAMIAAVKRERNTHIQRIADLERALARIYDLTLVVGGKVSRKALAKCVAALAGSALGDSSE